MNSPYITHLTGALQTPQTAPIPGREHEMVPNNAGGYGFILDDWMRLERFLITGSEGGTYYVGEQKLTAENAACVRRCIQADGPRAVALAHSINLANRAPKVDPSLFVMALAMKGGDAAQLAVSRAMPSMLRTGTHLLHFVAMLDAMGGWNRSKRRLISSWFTSREAEQVAFQALKYQNRDGWSMRDVLRVAHPKAPTPEHGVVYDWICGRVADDSEIAAIPILAAHRRMMHGECGLLDCALAGIEAGLPREALPTELLNQPEIWRALLPTMPPHALIRNLATMTQKGVLALNEVDSVATAVRTLLDRPALQRARVHPFALLLAMLVYRQGHGVRSDKSWIPVPAILSALEEAYDLAFDNVLPTGKRLLVGIDVSGSMSASCVGAPIQAAVAASAMALTLARVEPHAITVQFDSVVKDVVPVTRRTGIASIPVRASGGGTDIAAPIAWALQSRIEFDAIVVLTDNETWAGNMHVNQAMLLYRRQINHRARLIVCAMAANGANVVDPTDSLAFGCAGLDAHLPSLVADFIGQG